MCYQETLQHKGLKIVISNCFGIGFDWDDEEFKKSIETNDGRVLEVLKWASSGGAELYNKAQVFQYDISNRYLYSVIRYLDNYKKEELLEMLENPYLSNGAKDCLEAYFDGSLRVAAKKQKEDRKEVMENRKKIEGYIYLLNSGIYYKIGKAKNLKTRMDSLAVGVRAPFDIKLIHSFKSDDYSRDEQILHEKFSEKRTEGEWFILSKEDVSWICSLEGVK